MADGERVWFQNESEWPKPEDHVLHEFGRLKILRGDGPAAWPHYADHPDDLTRTERVGLAVLEGEASGRLPKSRQDDRFEGRRWDAPAVEPDDPPPLDCALVRISTRRAGTGGRSVRRG